jgi:uncharacterized membrane protein
MAKRRRDNPPPPRGLGNDIVGPRIEGEREIYVEQSLTWSAPIPPPEIVRGYNDVIENGAERLFRQFELEAEHRRALQRRGQTHNLIIALSGRGAALVFSLASLGVAALALYYNHPWVAGAFGSGTIALVVAAFTGVPNIIRQRMQPPKPPQQGS